MRNKAVKRLVVFAPLLLMVLFGPGCITTKNFESIPIDGAEFELPYQEITAKYPDILRYEGLGMSRFSWLSINSPLAQNLIEQWGNPDKMTTEWSYYPRTAFDLALVGVLVGGGEPLAITAGVVGIIRPLPPKTYVWQKGNYCIAARIDRSFLTYRETIARWKWIEMSTSVGNHDCKDLRKGSIASALQ